MTSNTDTTADLYRAQLHAEAEALAEQMASATRTEMIEAWIIGLSPQGWAHNQGRNTSNKTLVDHALETAVTRDAFLRPCGNCGGDGLGRDPDWCCTDCGVAPLPPWTDDPTEITGVVVEALDQGAWGWDTAAQDESWASDDEEPF